MARIAKIDAVSTIRAMASWPIPASPLATAANANITAMAARSARVRASGSRARNAEQPDGICPESTLSNASTSVIHS